MIFGNLPGERQSKTETVLARAGCRERFEKLFGKRFLDSGAVIGYPKTQVVWVSTGQLCFEHDRDPRSVLLCNGIEGVVEEVQERLLQQYGISIERMCARYPVFDAQ